MRRRVRSAAHLLGVFCSGVLTAGAALGAGAPLETGGFENYIVNSNLAGQQGWIGVGGGGSAVVQSTVVKSGGRAVKVDRAAGIDSRWAVPLGTTLPSHRFMLVDWDMRVTGTGATNGGFGPFFGMEAYDDQPSIGLLGSWGVDATTGDVLYQRQDDGAFIESGEVVAFNAWNSYRVLFDFTMNQYTVYLNGESIATTGFVDRGPLHTNLNQFTDADISAIAAGGDTASQNMTGTAYFDNFRVLDGVPGDFDFDGDVDAPDLALWKAAYGATIVGDADGDNDSDGTDFLIWQRNLGADLTPSVAATQAVPEPAAAVLAALAALALVRRR